MSPAECDLYHGGEPVHSMVTHTTDTTTSFVQLIADTVDAAASTVSALERRHRDGT